MESENRQTLKVLSLEDSFRDFEILRESLIEAGYDLKMDHAGNGTDFTWLLQQQTYDIILADFSLPGYDAFAALEKAREICPDVPFIVVSGSIGEETAIDLIKLGALDYVLKDRMERLPMAVKRALDEAGQKRARKQAEFELIQSEKRYQSLIETQTDLVSRFSREGNFAFVNEVFCSFFNKTRDELIGKKWSPLPVAEDLKHIEQKLSMISPSNPTVVIENRVLSGKGEMRWVQFVNQGFFDSSGRLLEIQSVGRDITELKQNLDRLNENYTLLRIAGETAKFGGWSVNVHEYVVVWSDTVADIHEMPRGYSPRVRDGINFYAPEWREKITQVFTACSEKGIPYDEEMEILTRTGKRVWVRTIGVAVRDETGKIIKVQGSLQDISEKKQSEEALRESETQYRTMIDASPLAITRNDTEGRILSWNRAAEKIFGFTESEVLGKFPPYMPESEKKEFERLRKQVIGGKVLTRIEGTRQRKDGTLILINLSTGALFDKTGKVAGYISIFEDITDRKKSEAERERLLAAIEQSDESIFITDSSGIIQYVNPAFESISGYKKEEIYGQNPRILKSGKQDAAFYENLWKTLLAGQTYKGRIINKRKDGSFYTEDASISPVFDSEGSIVNFVAVKRDVTPHIQLETQFQQAQKMESVGRLAGGVAHDFNNMLTIIMSYVQIAMKSLNPSSGTYKDLEQVDKAARKSADITRQLLAFARKQAVTPKILDLNETLESMLKMIRRLIGENIELIWHPGSALLPVMADPAQIDQIIANLCVNARDAIQGIGKINIETSDTILDEDYCRTHPGFLPGRFVTLSISDTGCGMSKDTLEKIFEPFFTTKEIGRGTGLGLATVYGIVKQSKGFINVYSEPQKGSTFKIYFPQHAGVSGPSAAEEEKKPVIGKGEAILVVEDDITILDLVNKILSGLNYKILKARTPSQALGLAEKNAGYIDLVLSDMVMPEMSGHDLARRLKILYPDLKLIFMSGYTEAAFHHQGESDNHIPYIQKPFGANELALKVRNTLDARF